MANTIGQILLGASFPTHPVYGARRDLEVLEVSPTTGRWTLGQITCPCGTTRDIHPGDHFQVTECVPCKEETRKQAKQAARASNPETAARKAEKLAAKADREAAKQATRESKAAERAAKLAAKETAKADKAKEKASLIAKVAAEKGVQISPNAKVA